MQKVAKSQHRVQFSIRYGRKPDITFIHKNTTLIEDFSTSSSIDAIIEETFGLGTLNDPSTRFALARTSNPEMQ